MPDDALKNMLKQADVTAGEPPPLPDNLAQRVRLLAARQHRRRVVSGFAAAAVVVLAVGTSALLWHSPRSLTPDGPAAAHIAQGGQERPDIASIKAEIERLDREASMRLAVVRRAQEILARRRRLEALRAAVPNEADAVVRAHRQVEQAARILVRQADQMCFELNLCDSAIVKYQRVVELFPETSWAAAARLRLSQIKAKKGEVS
jgi:hypothetical protein